jgi:hypothetical protein
MPTFWLPMTRGDYVASPVFSPSMGFSSPPGAVLRPAKRILPCQAASRTTALRVFSELRWRPVMTVFGTWP